LDKFNYDQLRVVIEATEKAEEATENAKKSMDALVKEFEEQRPHIKKLFDKMALLNQSAENLLNKLRGNQSGSNNSHLIY
jgi:prefoldin subunit 5